MADDVLIGQLIARVQYVGLPIYGEDPDPSDVRWDYDDWHWPEVGVELETESGRLFHATWGAKAGQFRLTFAEGPTDQVWPPLPTVEPHRTWEVTRHPHWRRLAATPIIGVGVVGDADEGTHEPVAMRVESATGYAWIVAAMPKTGDPPEDLRAADVYLPGDEIIVLFSDERAAGLGLSLPEIGSQ